MNKDPQQPNETAFDEPPQSVDEQFASDSESPPKLRKPRKPGLGIAIAVVVVLGYLGVKPRIDRNDKLERDVAAVKAESPTVSVVALKRVSGATEITLPSNLQAIEETTIDSRMSGYVRARYVDIGSKVKVGEVLAEVESPEVDQQLAQTQSEVSRAQAGVGQAQADVSRLEASLQSARSTIVMYQANVGQSRADLVHLEAKAMQASAAVKVAQAKLTQAEKRLDGAKAEFQRAKVGQAISQKTLARWKELEKSDAVSGQDVDEKQSDFDASLAKVDSAKANVNSAEADVMAAQETVKSQQAEYLATKADIRSGEQKIEANLAALSSARSNLQAAVAAREASRSNVVAAKANVGSNQANLLRTAAMQAYEHVVAPFSGVITARNVDVGDLVSATTSSSGASDPSNTVTKRGLFGLARTDYLLAQANVPEDSVSSIREGQDAEISAREYPGKLFVGKVFHVSGALDAISRTLRVEVKIPNPNGILKPGMFAQIRFLGGRSAKTVHIPATGLLFDAKGTRVAVISADSSVHFIEVKLGRDFGGEIEVLEGLKGDETLITNAEDSLVEGERVKAVRSQK